MEEKSSPDTIALADSFFELVRWITGDSQLEMHYGKYCIELTSFGDLGNNITIYPRKRLFGHSFQDPKIR